MNILGIDPGASGGIALLKDDGAQAWKMPATERDTWALICPEPETWIDVAYIEQVHSMPKQGVASTFKFGQNYGLLRGLLIAASIRFEAVPPRTWQGVFSLPSLKAAGSLTKKKNAHKARAQELFPDLKVTHANADALLIAEYGRRRRT